MNRDLIENYSPFVDVELSYVTKFLNEETALVQLEHNLRHLRVWDGKFNGHANWHSCRKEAMLLLGKFPRLNTAEAETLLSVSKALLISA